MAFVTSFVKQVVSSLRTAYPANFAGITDTELQEELQSTLEALMPNRLTLATSRPDYEATLFRFVQEIESTGVWNDAGISATGQMLLRLVSSDVTYSQFSMARCLQEAYPHTSRNESSIYANARGLGVQLSRNTPAKVNVRLDRGDPGTILTIPEWSQFSIDGKEYFNREKIAFLEADIDKDVVLYQGKVQTTSFQSTGVPYQTMEFGVENWKISNEDVRVVVNSVEWETTRIALFKFFDHSEVVHEQTLPNGNVMLTFGNGIYGKAPPSGVIIDVYWVECEGSSVNSDISGLSVEWENAPSGVNLTGVTLSATYFGKDRLPSSYYKVFAGDLRADHYGAVRRQGYRAKALEFPGVRDARFRGQAELNPSKPSWMNVVGATLLTVPTFTESQWQEFVAFMTDESIYSHKFIRLDPTPIDIDINYEVYCLPDADLDFVKRELERGIYDFFDPKVDTLGYSIYEHDLKVLLEGSGRVRTLVDYSRNLSTNPDIVLEGIDQWVRLNSVTLTMKYGTRGADYGGRVVYDGL